MTGLVMVTEEEMTILRMVRRLGANVAIDRLLNVPGMRPRGTGWIRRDRRRSATSAVGMMRNALLVPLVSNANDTQTTGRPPASATETLGRLAGRLFVVRSGWGSRAVLDYQPWSSSMSRSRASSSFAGVS